MSLHIWGHSSISVSETKSQVGVEHQAVKKELQSKFTCFQFLLFKYFRYFGIFTLKIGEDEPNLTTVIFFRWVETTKKTTIPGDSSRDHFISLVGGHLTSEKGHLTIPKRHKELPGNRSENLEGRINGIVNWGSVYLTLCDWKCV